MIDFQANDPFAGILRKLERLPERVDHELGQVNIRIGRRVVATARKILDREVYGVPIPLTAQANIRLKPGSKVRTWNRKGRHGQWRRTGELLRGETFAVSREGRGSHSVTLTNPCDHADARLALGQPDPPNHARRRAGVQRDQSNRPPSERSQTRPVNWRRDAIAAEAEYIEAQYAAVIGQALEDDR